MTNQMHEFFIELGKFENFGLKTGRQIELQHASFMKKCETSLPSTTNTDYHQKCSLYLQFPVSP